MEEDDSEMSSGTFYATFGPHLPWGHLVTFGLPPGAPRSGVTWGLFMPLLGLSQECSSSLGSLPVLPVG